MLEPNELLALYDLQERRNAHFGMTERYDTARSVRVVGLQGNPSFVLYSDLRGLDDAAIERAIDGEIAFFAARQADFEWKVYRHDAPPDLDQRLARRGFTLEPWETLLVIDLQDAPARLFDDRGHRVVRLTDPAQVDDVRVVHDAVWGGGTGEERADRMRHEMVETPDQTSIFVAYLDLQPVGAGWLYYTDGSDFGSLFGGSVCEEYRGRGVYGALLAARAREARERGRRYLMIDAGPMSQPIVERLGFVPLDQSRPCLYEAHQPFLPQSEPSD